MTRRPSHHRHHRHHRHPLWAVVLLLALLLSACGRQAPAPEIRAATLAPAALQTLVERTLHAPSADAEALLHAALGAPLHRETEVVANRHDPARDDRVHALVYANGRAVVYEAVALGRSYLLELEVHADYLGPDGVGIGSDRDAVIAAYGDGLRDEGDALTLTLTSAGDRLRLAFSDGRVVRMVWQFYAG